MIGVCASLWWGGCSEHFEIARDRPVSSAGSGAGAGSGGLSSGGANAGNPASAGAAHECRETACQGKVYRCGDCIDNDGDQQIDSDDPDCTGPCDDTEDSYFGGIPGQNNAPCRQDCYFDQDTGSGNDQCFWSHTCDALSLAPNYPPSGEERCGYTPGATVPGSNATCETLENKQAEACLGSCLPITPNGCDCFGCCELPADSGRFVFIGAARQNAGTCDAAHVDDPAACPPCTQVPSCRNECDPCEVCVGRGAPLPGCRTPGLSRCPARQTACGLPGEPACAANEYCVTCCCAPAPR